MAKAKNTIFFCKECGYEVSKWQGQCPGCKEWNTLVEAPAAPKKTAHTGISSRSTPSGFAVPGSLRPQTLKEIAADTAARIRTGFRELDRVLGGGIVAGSLVLVGGDPGIGKSTLLLQVCKNLSGAETRVLYISGEESLHQIKLRADRMGEFSDNLSLLCETSLDVIEPVIREAGPKVVIIDSIQTMFRESVDAAPGSVSQVRESTMALLQIAKGMGISIFIVGHVTKEGTVAGPRMLEHMVDTVLYFEGDRHASYRILRGVKNRFGSTNEIGVFEMCGDGLHEVPNPSQYLLSGRPQNASGSVVTCAMEGTRPLLLEIQALVCRTNFGQPRRTAAGTDYNRVNLLMAVLEKRMGLRLGECDAYVNIAGGMRINEPALDLGIIMAIVSSYRDLCIPDDTMIFGEVGLSGEVRAVNMADQRIAEAERLGFTTCILPRVSLQGMRRTGQMRLIGISNVGEALKVL
ncbi:MAG: DNA repair protein RadA [Lachnospiraceae bacterium]|jgi:DNA repair protein RadA/Sms|nr:DNA repair protein RadA [Lachnospiraceae bacterium]